MSVIYAATIAIQMGVGIYLMLSRHLVRVLFGLVILSTAANLLIFVAGGLGSTLPPIIINGSETLAEGSANPLPQALILTAIVIGFALVAFTAALVMKAHASLGSVLTNEQNAAEELGSPFAGKASNNE